MNIENNLKNLENEALNSLFIGNVDNTKYLCNNLLTQSIIENNKYYEASSYGILGYMFYEAELYHEAINYLLKAISISNEADRGYIDNGHLALCYSKLNDLDNANLYVDKAINSAIELNNHPGKYEWFNFKGNLLYKLKLYDQALEWVEKSINEITFLITPDKPEIIFYMPYLTKYEIYCELGLKNECIVLENKLKEFFIPIQNPIMHLKRDKKKFLKLLNSV